MKSKKDITRSVIVALVIVFIAFFSRIIALYTDFLWFDALGFKELFTTPLIAKFALFFIGAFAFAFIAGINVLIASRVHKADLPRFIPAVIISAAALFFGIFASGGWLTSLQYLNQVQFGLVDPILSMDAAFYVFSLPFFILLWKFLFSAVLVTTVMVVLYYLHQFLGKVFTPNVDPHTGMNLKSVNVKKELAGIKRVGLVHMAVLGSAVFVLLALKHYLARYSVMYSKEGIVVGAGYTDVMVFLPVVKFLAVFALAVAVLFYVWIFYFSQEKKFKKHHILLFVVIVYLGFVFIGQTVAPAIVQSLVVSPNEINLEQPFIDNNIRFTRIAYGLDDVEEHDFDVTLNITPDLIAQERKTIDNVRILDWRPLTQTYKQTQEIRLYYDLSGIDIDRYDINGSYTQVMLAPRELDQSQIASNAKTWVNLHMVYSHGFGVVMSPVNKVTDQGLPDYLMKDVPPVYSVPADSLKIDEPRIYYGERDNNFVLVNTGTEEFDYPQGNSNKYIRYDGKGGVILDSFLRKLLMAARFSDIKILLSSDITPESRILFFRNIQERIDKLTPFLDLDSDPYLVIADGKLYWMQDAYTTTGNFPYSEKIGGINYIRNAVKIVVDAYDGTVDYYVIDTEDPLIRTYAKIFPGQFRSFKDMPESLKEHIRYPEGLFSAQAAIYSTYHMEDTTVFYNKEDAWQTPYEVYGTGEQVSVDPYYIIMKLPGETNEEFVLMTTFTPIRKDNMIAWLAARSDKVNYGKLLMYKFPKDKLIYGPLQIEAKIDQDSEISQQLTLWSQQGSRVTRGNLLVIPIDHSLLYIEPLYIQAEQGQLPELKRVLVSDGDRVVMERDFETALRTLFGKSKQKTRTGEEIQAEQDILFDSSEEELITKAGEHYKGLLNAMQEGDWESFGENFDRLGEVLEALDK